MLRVTADTNVYISALQFAGQPLRILELALQESISLWASPVIMQEIVEVLRGKFGRSEADVEEIMLHLARVTQIVVPIERVYAVEDDLDDNAILECAIASHSDFIVSGDRHLLRLGEHRGIPIVRVVEFLGRIHRATAPE
ncbi:MAG TPA: putative toxin-antitoxin system toxin component, PIN family [Bryobacteraceae bacterium]|nr:putative toxin-antitoxin system toxin component, PIN family [Bryobacteraceae bacterium]